MNPIYLLTFTLLWEALTPPLLRKSIMFAWGSVLVNPLQWFHDIIFEEYVYGSAAPVYNNATAYSIGDRVVYTDRGVYEATQAGTGNLPTDTDFWLKISDNYIGIIERTKYTAQIISFEFGLNRWFQSVGIFITNNNIVPGGFIMGEDGALSSAMANSSSSQIDYLGNAFSPTVENSYTINVPTAVFDALGANDTDRENVVRSFADKFNLAGMIYNVVKF